MCAQTLRSVYEERLGEVQKAERSSNLINFPSDVFIGCYEIFILGFGFGTSAANNLIMNQSTFYTSYSLIDGAVYKMADKIEKCLL